MLMTVIVGDNFVILVTDSLQWKSHQLEEKSNQYNDSATHILKLSTS